MKTDFLTYKENERRPLSKNEKLLLILAEVVFYVAIFLLEISLFLNLKLRSPGRNAIGIALIFTCSPWHYFLRKRTPKNEEEIEIKEKTLSIKTAFILYAAFMIINILLCIFLYPIKIDYIVARDFFESSHPFITSFLVAFSDISLKKAKVKGVFRWLFAVSFFIPLLIEIIVTHI